MKPYIAGPMTGLPGFNHDAFRFVELQLERRTDCYFITNPADGGTEGEWADFLKRDISKMLFVNDCVVALHNWGKSVGASLEVFVALMVGMPVYELPPGNTVPGNGDYGDLGDVVDWDRFHEVCHMRVKEQLCEGRAEIRPADGERVGPLGLHVIGSVKDSPDGKHATVTFYDEFSNEFYGEPDKASDKAIDPPGVPPETRVAGRRAIIAEACKSGSLVMENNKQEPWIDFDIGLDDPETVCEEAQRLVYGERCEEYGHPLDDYNRTAKLWSAILGTEVTPFQAAQCMICVKLSRLCNDPSKRDSIVDIAGYAECLQRINDEQKARGS